MKRKKGDLKDLADSLSELEEKICKENPQFQFWQLQKKWDCIVGDIMAKESYIGYTEGPVLYIYITNSAWCQEMMILKKDILKKIRAYPAGKNIEEIRFQIGNKLNAEKNIYLPGINRKKDSPVAGIVSDQEKVKIEVWMKERVPKELKSTFVRMIIESLKRKRGEERAGWKPCERCGILCRKEETLCVRCRIQKEREVINHIILILKEEPHFKWEDVKKFVSCSYEQYEEAWETLVYRYRDCIYNRNDTAEERKKLFCLQLHRPLKEVTEEEIERMMSRAPRKINGKGCSDIK